MSRNPAVMDFPDPPRHAMMIPPIHGGHMYRAKPKSETEDERRERLRENREYTAEYRQRNRTHLRVKDAARKRAERCSNSLYAQNVRAGKRRPEVRARRQATRQSDVHKAKAREYRKAYRARSELIRSKDKARMAAWQATQQGLLVVPEVCQLCGCNPGKGPNGCRLLRADHWHGYDAEHWLDVQWVCPSCDGRTTRETRDAD